MKEAIFNWLNEKDTTDTTGLRNKPDFISFLSGLFPNKNEDQIKQKVLQMNVAYGTDIENFSSGLATSLA
jgi:hypothetical protein